MRWIAASPLLLAIASPAAHAEERPGAESAAQLISIAPRTAYERCLRLERTSANPSALELAMLRLKCGDAPGTKAPPRP